MRRSRIPHCRRRAIPWGLKLEIVLRQNGVCADCGSQLTPGALVFDHRPPLAVREFLDDANDPQRLAAICMRCNRHKTPRDLRQIARVKRRGLTYDEHLERQRLRLVSGQRVLCHDFNSTEATDQDLEPSDCGRLSPHEAAVRRAEALWALEEAGLGSWPPFSKSDLT
jgi:hypothetical protein